MTFTARSSCQWVYLRMISFLGIPDLAPAPTSSTPDAGRAYETEGMRDECAGIMTAALQDIAEDGPASLTQIDTGGVLYPPATITLNVTQNNAAAVPTGFLPWMVGCSVIIQGDGYLNEFVNGLGRLRRPYLGPTATGIQATVYCNAVPLPLNVKNVLEPVRVGNFTGLVPCGDRATFDRLGGCGYGYITSLFQPGQPQWFYVDSIYDDTQSISPNFLRVAPAPSFAPVPISYKARVLPQVINVEDLGDNTQDPAVFPTLPGGFTESVFLPYCLIRWSGSPLFKNAEALPEIQRQYLEAKKKLAGFKPNSAIRKGGTQAFRP